LSWLGDRAARRSSKSDQGPQFQDWSEFGDHRKVLPKEGGAGWETPGRFKATVKELGREHGVTRVQRERALGADSGPNRYVDGAVGVRQEVRRQKSLNGAAAAQRRQATAPARKSGAAATRQGWREWLATLKREALPRAEGAQRRAREALEDARQGLFAM